MSATENMPAPQAGGTEPQAPERGPLWSLLDWSFWGAGMGDVFREPLADKMLAAVPTETVAQAEAAMAEFIERRNIEKTGVTVYQEQRDELEKLRERVAELEAAPRTVYRASHDSIAMGLYTTREAAMDHVHGTLANEEGGDVTARVIWRADDPEADNPTWECWLFDTDMADDNPTGYVVTPLEVASHYDEECDE